MEVLDEKTATKTALGALLGCTEVLECANSSCRAQGVRLYKGHDDKLYCANCLPPIPGVPHHDEHAAYVEEQTVNRAGHWRDLHSGADLRTGTSFQQVEHVVSELNYACYAHNRRENPLTPFEKWAAIFGEPQVQAMERRFTSEELQRHAKVVTIRGAK